MARSRRVSAFAVCMWSGVKASKSIARAVQAATKILQRSKIPEAAASAEYLATACFDEIGSRSDARSSHLKPNANQLEQFIKLCRKREEQRVPVQYLIGDWDFHNIQLLVRAPVLIPRPETEELVEHLLKTVENEEANILDVGCGSGAIFLAALTARTGWRAVGIDIAEEAVRLSQENVRLLGLEDRSRVLGGNVYDVAEGGRVFDALVSNPPYICSADIDELAAEVKDHEDIRALCGGTDGLDVVREILHVAPQIVKSGGSVWLELDVGQSSELEGMKFEGLEFVEKVNDGFGKERFCHMRID